MHYLLTPFSNANMVKHKTRVDHSVLTLFIVFFVSGYQGLLMIFFNMQAHAKNKEVKDYFYSVAMWYEVLGQNIEEEATKGTFTFLCSLIYHLTNSPLRRRFYRKGRRHALPEQGWTDSASRIKRIKGCLWGHNDINSFFDSSICWKPSL